MLFSHISFFCFGQNKQKTNLEIFEESISAELEKFIFLPDINRNFQFIFIVNPNEQSRNISNSENETKFLAGVIKKTASNNKLNFSFTKERGSIKTDSNYYLFYLQIHKLETRYTGFKKNKFLGEKTLTRNIAVKIAVNIESHDKKVSITDFISADRKDEINLDGYETLESSQHYFTRGVVPEVGLFERVIFPVILITVTAVITILFFVIRSK